MKTQLHLVLILALLAIAAPVMGKKVRTPAADPFVGTYKKALGFSWDRNRGESVMLTKTNGVYYFNSHSMVLPFTNASPSHLKNQSMGAITLGQMRFADQKDEAVPVRLPDAIAVALWNRPAF